MNKKLLVALSLIAGQAMAMELTIDNEHALPTNTTEQKVVIQIQDQEKELPVRFIPLSGTLKNLSDDLPEFYKEGTPVPVSLASWQLIESQLERVYKSTQGDTRSRDEILADYIQLDSRSLIDLMSAVKYLDIPLLKEITLELAQNKLTSNKILELPEYVHNDVIKRKALKVAGPVVLKELAVSRCREDEVWSVCVTLDNKIVLGSGDKTVRIWDMHGQELAVCRGYEGKVRSVCVTSDNKIVSGSFDNTVRIRGRNGQKLAVCRGHEGVVHSVCVTPDNKIVSGSWDKTVRIWDINGKELAVCRGHEGEIHSVCVTPDNKIVSGSADKTIRVWDMNGQKLAVCRGHEELVRSVCVTHANKIISRSFDKTMLVWDMRDIRVFDHLSVMSKKQAQLIGMMLGWTEKLLNCVSSQAKACKFLLPDLSWHERVNEIVKIVDQKEELVLETENLMQMMGWIHRFLKCILSQNQAKACAVTSEHCWKEIEKILEEGLVVETKKRKELENSKNNPAKKVRLLEEEELGIESKEGRNHV